MWVNFHAASALGRPQQQRGLAGRSALQCHSGKPAVKAHLQACRIVGSDVAFQAAEPLQLPGQQGCTGMSIPV